MSPELLPVVDLRLLSQSDLTTLSLSSSSAFDLRRCDDVVVPKIDRSVFNESAGSRKQTFSRLRLPTRRPPSPSPSDPGRRENDQIVAFLRRLFSPSSAPSPSPSQPQSQPRTVALALAAPPPLPAEPPSMALVVVEDRDKEVLNAKGAAVDIAALGAKEDPFGPELRRRTEGMVTEETLLGFLSGVDGQWGSRRKKRKIVDAAAFGDDLPRGWKLLLGLRRKDGIARLDCRRYISPNGKQFVSCKEVASYMFCLVGNQDAKQQISPQDGIVADPTSQSYITKDNPGYLLVMPISSVSADQEKPSALFSVEKQAKEPKKVLECHKCNLTFGDKEALVQHLLSFHQRSAKRRRLGVGEGVIIKDGKYECQFCHKVFSERHRYNGHVGTHVRGVDAEAFLAEKNMRKIMNPTPLAAVPFYEMDALTNKQEETDTAKSVVGSSTRRLKMENNETIQNDAPETSEVACTNTSVNDSINNHDAKHDVTEKIAENCGTTSTQSKLCAEATCPMTDTNNEVQECSRDSSQQVSVNKSLRDQINSTGMDGYKSEEIAENCSVEVTTPTVCLNTISPCLPVVGNTPLETINTTSMSKSVDSHVIEFDTNGFKSKVIVEDSSVRDIKRNECLNALSASRTNTDNATCNNVNENGLLSMNKSIGGSDSCDIIRHKFEKMVDPRDSMFVEPNSCLDASSPTFINLDSMTCEGSNENALTHMGTAICENVNGNDLFSLSKSIGGADGCDNIGCKSEEMVDASNSTIMEPNTCLDALSPSLINIDSMACEPSNDIYISSCTMISGIEKCSEEQKVDSENVLLTTSDNRTSYDVEAYSNDILTSTMKDQDLAEMNLSSNEFKSDTASCHIFSDKVLFIGSSSSECLPSVGTGHPTSIISSSVDCTFHSDMKVSMLKEMNELSSEVDNCFHRSKAENDAANAAETRGTNPLHDNVTKTDWLYPPDGLPILDMIPGQSEDELNSVGQKHGNISGYEELSIDVSEPMEFVFMAGPEPLPASQSTNELGYVAELDGGSRPPIDLDWGSSLPNMVGGSEFTVTCMWCGGEIDREGISAELRSDMVGFMCQTCKERIPGQTQM